MSTTLTQIDETSTYQGGGQDFKCTPIVTLNPDNAGNDGFFFGQGNKGKTSGIIGCIVVAGFVCIFAALNFFFRNEDGNMFSDVIHVFGFSIWNILALLFIFGIAPFGYQFWLGRCKNNHPGELIDDKKKLSDFLAWIPFIASIILVMYPASLIMAGNITNWSHKTVLGVILMFFGFYGSLEYWPAFIKNTYFGGQCNTSPNDFSANKFHFIFYLAFAAIAGLVINLAGNWVWMVVTSGHDWSHGVSPIELFRNILITIGLVLTNLFGGLRLYEGKKKA